MNPPPPLLPEAAERLLRARHNYSLFQVLQAGGAHLDWAVTVLFYTALQLVDAHGVQNGWVVSNDHEARRGYVKNRLASIRYQYRNLEDASRDARYELWMPDAQDVQEYHDREFKHIEAQLRNRGIGL